MKPPHERALRPDTTLDSPATRGKLPSPERGGQTKNLSVHPSTKTGQLHTVYDEGRDQWKPDRLHSITSKFLSSRNLCLRVRL